MANRILLVLVLLLVLVPPFHAAPERHAYLIGLRPDVSLDGFKIERRFSIVNAVVTRMTPRVAKELAQSGKVRYVEEDAPVYVLEQTVPWGVNRVNPLPIGKGTGVGVAVLDTGIEAGHEDLTVVLGTNTIDDTPWGEDGHGHGTHVAGTVAALDNDIGVIGVAPKADLYAVKVLDEHGYGTVSSVVAGIEWAVEHDVPILNMSLGSPYSETMEEACDAAYAAGHLLVAAAGNDWGGPVGYPAAYESVIAVSASNSADELATFSSVGPEVELIAPGASIYSTTSPNTYVRMSGTSMASPHVAGVAALVWSAESEMDNVGVRERLQETAEELGLALEEQGYGLVQAPVHRYRYVFPAVFNESGQ